MSRTYLKNVRIVDGTGAPAIENGLYVFDTIADKFNEDVVEYVGCLLYTYNGRDRCFAYSHRKLCQDP